MNYLYGKRRGMGQAQTLPGAESGGAYGQPCNIFGGAESGCPPGTRCTNMGASSVCMPTCISTVECPPGLVCVDGSCVPPPNVEPPSPNPPSNTEQGCPSWNNIPVYRNGQSSCTDPDQISDEDIAKNPAFLKARLYQVYALSVGRLGTQQDEKDVALNRYMASLSTAERQKKYDQLASIIRTLAESYELVRKVNEIAIVGGNQEMIRRTLNDELEIRQNIQAIRQAQFQLRQIQVLETGKGLTITGYRQVQGLGLPQIVVYAGWTLFAAGTAYIVGYGVIDLTERYVRATNKEKHRIELATKNYKALYAAWLACYQRNEGETMTTIIDRCGKEPNLQDIINRTPMPKGPLDDLIDGISSLMWLGAIGAVGYITLPFAKALIEKKTAELGKEKKRR